MANRVDIQVGVDDQTQAGNASVVAGAESTKQTLDQKHQEMLAQQRAIEEKFARDNAAIFLDIQHEKFAKTAAEFEQLQQRHKAAEAKFLDNATKPLTPGQQQAAEAAQAIIRDTPPPVVQKVVNDVQPIDTAAVPPVDDTARQAALKQADALTAKLAKSTEILHEAMRSLAADHAKGFSESELAMLKRIEDVLRKDQVAALQFADSLRDAADINPNAAPLGLIADNITKDVLRGSNAVEILEAKIKEIDAVKATATIEAAGVEKTLSEFRKVSEEAVTAATKATEFWASADNNDHLASKAREAAEAIRKTGNNSEAARSQIASLLAQADGFDSVAADFRHLATEEENVARSALRAAHEFGYLANQEGQAGQEAQRLIKANQQSVASLDAVGAAAHRAGSAMNTAGGQINKAGGLSGQGIMQLAYAADDLQYGLRGIVNNIPGLLQSLGLGAGLAGVVSILAVGLNQLEQRFGVFAKMGDYFFAATAEAKQLADQIEKVAERKKAFESLDDADAARAVSKQQQHLKEITSLSEIKKLISDIEFDIENGGKNIGNFVPKEAIADGADPERLKKNREKEIEVLKAAQAQVDSIVAKNKATALAEQIQYEEQHRKRLRTIAEIQDAERELAEARQRLQVMQRSAPKQEAELDREKKRIADDRRQVEQDHKNLITENVQAVDISLTKQREQNTEFRRQAGLLQEILSIEQERSRITKGTDDPQAEQDRRNAELNRERLNEHANRAVEVAKFVADAAQSNTALTDEQKKKARDDYNAAVMTQIETEAATRRQSIAEQEALQKSQAEKLASLDQRLMDDKQAALSEAKKREQIARDADAKADAGVTAKDVAARKETQAAWQAATQERLKAEADLQKQAIENRTRQQRQAVEDVERLRQLRITAEQAVGKAREKALLDADAVEKRLAEQKEADRIARLQAALKADPRMAAIGEKLVENVKPKDIERNAARQVQDDAEKNFRDAEKKAGRDVKPEDVKDVRRNAFDKFQQDKQRGEAGGQLADARNRIAQRAVDDAERRGQIDPQAAQALRLMAQQKADADREKADAEKRLNDLNPPRDAAEVAQRRRDAARAKQQDVENRKADRQAEGDANRRQHQDRDAIDFRKAKEKLEQPAKPVEIEPEADPIDAEDKAIQYAEQNDIPLPNNGKEMAALIHRMRKAEQEIAEIRRRPVGPKLPKPLQPLFDDNQPLVRKREPVLFGEDNQPDPQPQQPEALNGAGGCDTIAMPVEIDDADAKAELDDLTKPREVVVTARTEKRAEITGQQDVDRVADTKRTPSGQDPSAAALKNAESAMAKMANAQAQANAEVVAALGSLTKLVTDQANRHVALHDVVAQITGHINNTAAQFAREDNSARLRAISSAGV